MGEYFKSKIYNNGRYFSLDEPAFSILSNEDGFGINEAVSSANKTELKKIFVIFSGQQTLGDQYVGDDGDLLFCSRLTGGDRIGRNPNNVDKSFWFGEYRVRNSNNPKYQSVAGDLYDACGHDSIIIDVLNTKYDWQMDPFYFGKIEEYIKKTVIDNIYCKLNEDNRKRVKFTVCGFSRGGILSLRMGEILRDYFGVSYRERISSIITVDPVVNPMTENELIDSLLVKQRGKWVRKSKGTFIPNYFSPDLVPVLRSVDGIRYYNVCQRRAWSEQLNVTKKPIGSVVSGAVSLFTGSVPGGYSADVTADLSQYDMGVNSHTPEMLGKYADGVFKLCVG